MVTTLTQLFQRAKREPGAIELEVPADWMQGRSIFGGLQVAIALEAMRTCVPDAVLRTLQTTFVAPVAAGKVQARARVLRQGKNATHVEARLLDGGETQAVVMGVFGHARSSKAARLPLRPPLDASSPFEVSYVPGVSPSFVQHFRRRWLKGPRPFAGQATHEQVVEVGMLDEGMLSEAHLVAIADFIAPVALSYLDAPAPASTLTWMLELLCDDVRRFPLDGFRLDAELTAARDGYTNQSVVIWAPDATAVALSRQSMLVFG